MSSGLFLAHKIFRAPGGHIPWYKVRELSRQTSDVLTDLQSPERGHQGAYGPVQLRKGVPECAPGTLIVKFSS